MAAKKSAANWQRSSLIPMIDKPLRLALTRQRLKPIVGGIARPRDGKARVPFRTVWMFSQTGQT